MTKKTSLYKQFPETKIINQHHQHGKKAMRKHQNTTNAYGNLERNYSPGNKNPVCNNYHGLVKDQPYFRKLCKFHHFRHKNQNCKQQLSAPCPRPNHGNHQMANCRNIIYKNNNIKGTNMDLFTAMKLLVILKLVNLSVQEHKLTKRPR